MQNNNSKFKILLALRCYFSLFAFRFKFNKGFGLIEIVVSTALIASSLFALAAIARTALRASGEGLSATKGSYLAEEALEAVRSIRDDGWTANISPLVLGETYYPEFSSSKWELFTTSPGLIDGAFERNVVFEEVFRRTSDDNIVPADSPDDKELDEDTLKITASVSWPRAGSDATSSVELINYLTNLFED